MVERQSINPAPQEVPQDLKAEAERALQRNYDNENFQSLEENARQQAFVDAKGNQLRAVSGTPDDGENKPKLMRAQFRRAVEAPPAVLKRAEDLNASIAAFASELLQDPLRDEFIPDGADERARKVYATQLSRIDELLRPVAGEKKNGTPTKNKVNMIAPYWGTLANNSGYALEAVKELYAMDESAITTTKQKEYIAKVRRLFQQVLDGDPEKTQKEALMTHADEIKSGTVEKGKGAAKFIGLVVIGGFALASGLLDLGVNKSLSFYSLFWIGMTAWGSGMLKGTKDVVESKLRFLGDPEWETIMNKFSGASPETIEETFQKIRKTWKSRDWFIKNAHLYETKGTIDTEKLLKEMFIKEPEEMRGDIATLLRTLSGAELKYMIDRILNVNDKNSQSVMRFFVENKEKINSRAVARDISALR